MTIELDHITTYADVDDLPAHLGRYQACGFVTDERRSAYANGAQAGRITFGADYIEVLAVPDLDAFDRNATANDKLVYLGARPFGVGFRTPALDFLRSACESRGVVLPEPTTIHATDVQTGTLRDARLVQFPLKLLRGASCFAVERTPVVETVPAPNGTCALAGITLVSDEAEDRARQWRELLAPDEPPARALKLGPHHAIWSTPGEFRARFRRDWRPARHPLGELAVVHLISSDLALTERCVDGNAVMSKPTADTLLVEVDPRDGLLLAITTSA